MSGYTIGEIIVWLLLAAILGFVLGWLLRTLKCQRQHGDATAAKSSVTAPTEAPASVSTAKRSLVGDAGKAPVKKAAQKSVVAPGKFPGSAKPLAGGKAPSAEYVIKGNEDSMIYHTPQSPSYDQTIAETWFKTEAAAVAAGFRKPLNA